METIIVSTRSILYFYRSRKVLSRIKYQPQDSSPYLNLNLYQNVNYTRKKSLGSQQKPWSVQTPGSRYHRFHHCVFIQFIQGYIIENVLLLKCEMRVIWLLNPPAGIGAYMHLLLMSIISGLRIFEKICFYLILVCLF